MYRCLPPSLWAFLGCTICALYKSTYLIVCVCVCVCVCARARVCVCACMCVCRYSSSTSEIRNSPDPSDSSVWEDLRAAQDSETRCSILMINLEHYSQISVESSQCFYDMPWDLSFCPVCPLYQRRQIWWSSRLAVPCGISFRGVSNQHDSKKTE
jgi:hypothetical protein